MDRDDLQREAEQQLAAQGIDLSQLSPEHLRDLIYELQIQNIELSRLKQDKSSETISKRLPLLEAMAANINDAILITEADPIDEPGPRIVYANPGFTRMTGYSEAEILGISPRFLQGDETDRTVLDDIREALLAQDKICCELVNYKKNGDRFWVELDIVPVWDERDQCKHFVAVQRDITQRKEVDYELELQLRQTQKMEALGQLAGGVAHHFNNILTALIGYIELSLLELSPDHIVVDDLKQAREISLRAAALTQQLLTFTRQQLIQPQVINLNRLIIDMNTMLNQFIRDNIKTEMVLAPNLDHVEIDPNQFEQLLLNLVLNACDAMPEGGTLTIQTANLDLNEDLIGYDRPAPAGNYVVLSVVDTGVGMSETVQSRMFEPFFTTKEVGQGTGLGLSTCFGIIRQNKGYLTVESVLAQGTTIKVYLPRKELDPVFFEPATGAGQSGETVLMVEDDLAVRQLAARILRQQNYHVLEAVSGQEAIRLIRDNPDRPLNLLITNVVMPEMGGIALARHLQEIHPQLRVLFMSGYAEEDVLQTENLPSNSQFLAKPFTPTTLLGLVRQVLD